MALKAFIPFTQARRERLYAMSLQKMKGGAEVLLQIEWPDGTITYEPGAWHAETTAWLSESDKRFYQVGNGRAQYSLLGVPVVPVASNNAGVVTAEASKISNRELSDTYVDETGRPLEVVEKDDEGDPVAVQYADGGGAGVAADGGLMRVGEDVELHYAMDEPAPDSDAQFDGEVLSRADAGLIDPFPVSRHEADQAVKFAQSAGDVGRSELRSILMGIAIGFGLIMLFIILMWLMGQIGGDGGGGGAAVNFGTIALEGLR